MHIWSLRHKLLTKSGNKSGFCHSWAHYLHGSRSLESKGVHSEPCDSTGGSLICVFNLNFYTVNNQVYQATSNLGKLLLNHYVISKIHQYIPASLLLVRYIVQLFPCTTQTSYSGHSHSPLEKKLDHVFFYFCILCQYPYSIAFCSTPVLLDTA